MLRPSKHGVGFFNRLLTPSLERLSLTHKSACWTRLDVREICSSENLLAGPYAEGVMHHSPGLARSAPTLGAELLSG